MANQRVPVLVDTLPATPCTPEMRQAMVQISKEENTSIADLQRQAITLFLSQYDSKTISKDSETIQKLEVIHSN